MYDYAKRIFIEFDLFLDKIPSILYDKKETPDGWSFKEVIGHLVDSACNFHQKLIRIANDEKSFLPYDQEKWVDTANYKIMDFSIIRNTWLYYNQVILNIIKYLNLTSKKNKLQIGDKVYTIAELVKDYYNHLLHHKDQIKRIMVA